MEALFLSRADAYIRYLHFPGRDPAHVYLHGLGTAAAATFARVICGSPLAAQCSIMPDLIGYGYSDHPEAFGYTAADHAETIASLLDALQKRGCVVVGHSMGGAVAITLAARRPDLVSRLFLMEANLDPGGGTMSNAVAAMSEEEFVSHGHQDLASRFREIGRDDPIYAAYVGMWQIASPRAIYRGAVDLVRGTQPSWREMLYKLAVPRTYILGDKSLPDPDSEILPTHGIRIAIVRHAGHAMSADNPEGLAAALCEA